MVKIRPKNRGKKNVFDEWEHSDIDRNEQREGLKRRELRWKELIFEERLRRKREQACPKCGYPKNIWIKRGSGLHKYWVCDNCGFIAFKEDFHTGRMYGV